jgi:hypothetical protein
MVPLLQLTLANFLEQALVLLLETQVFIELPLLLYLTMHT